LPNEYKKMCDITFDRLYPNKEIIEKIANKKICIEDYVKNNSWILRDGYSIEDLYDEIVFLSKNLTKFISLKEVFSNKYILCPEGFDCSSSLNLVLSTNCLAICPPFHYSNTIINIDYLKPYVHFVPIKEDYSDLLEVMKWCLNNDEKCQEIVKNANEYSKYFLSEKQMIESIAELLKEIIKTN
jgi:hypothetical protein